MQINMILLDIMQVKYDLLKNQILFTQVRSPSYSNRIQYLPSYTILITCLHTLMAMLCDCSHY